MNKLKARLAPFTFKVMLMHSYLNEEKVSLRIKRTKEQAFAVQLIKQYCVVIVICLLAL